MSDRDEKPTAEPQKESPIVITGSESSAGQRDAAAEAAEALGLDANDIRRAMKIIDDNRKARTRR